MSVSGVRGDVNKSSADDVILLRLTDPLRLTRHSYSVEGSAVGPCGLRLVVSYTITLVCGVVARIIAPSVPTSASISVRLITA